MMFSFILNFKQLSSLSNLLFFLYLFFVIIKGELHYSVSGPFWLFLYCVNSLNISSFEKKSWFNASVADSLFAGSFSSSFFNKSSPKSTKFYMYLEGFGTMDFKNWFYSAYFEIEHHRIIYQEKGFFLGLVSGI